MVMKRKSFVLKSTAFVMVVMLMMTLCFHGVSAEESWLWPLAGTNSSNVTPGRGFSDGHGGVDIGIGVYEGMEVRAVKSGVVTRSSNACPHKNRLRELQSWDYKLYCNGGCGNFVEIDHGDGTKSRYLHLVQGSAIQVGTSVKRGDYVGKVGCSGQADGVHLHFDLWRNGQKFNNNPQNVSYDYANTVTPNNTNTSKEITISDQNAPNTLNVGNVFSIRGVVNSGEVLTNVTAGVYDVSGNMKTGKSANPNSTSYNIKALDPYVYFNSLQPGVYTYKVTARTASKSVTLVDKPFAVLTNQATLPNGKYKIKLANNNQFALSVEHNKKEDSVNIHLWTYKWHNIYERWNVTYAGNGYYTIVNAASKKALDVSGAGSSSGTNVHQYHTNGTDAQLWQILKTSKGYCLIPKCAVNCCLDLSGNTRKDGTNIQIYTINLTTAQFWAFMK